MVRQHGCLTSVKTLHTSPQSQRGKRKRRPSSPEPQEDDTQSESPQLPLTRPNLLALSESTHQESKRSTRTHPHPYEAMVYPTPSAEKASTTGKSKEAKTKTATSGLDAEAILDIYNIHLRRQLEFSNELAELVRHLQSPRHRPTTPNSKWVHAFKANPHKLREPTQIHAMVKHLVFHPHWYPGDPDGESLVAMEIDQQWTAEVPKPPGYTHDIDLQNAMAKFGLPPSAKPDITYGYNDNAFPGPLLNRVKALPQEMLVYSAAPWMPWQTIQWKTSQGSQAKA
ncbi:MAG: hypothetical protein LQ337_007253 [Flavoplaca oasis]|nr:MAG: hypothetical protein LQ337_007253 [Flavoplaca oasis]